MDDSHALAKESKRRTATQRSAEYYVNNRAAIAKRKAMHYAQNCERIKLDVKIRYYKRKIARKAELAVADSYINECYIADPAVASMPKVTYDSVSWVISQIENSFP